MLKLEYHMIDGEVIKCREYGKTARDLQCLLNLSTFVLCDCYGETRIISSANIVSVLVEEEKTTERKKK